MMDRLRSVAGILLICALVAVSMPALALPNGTLLLTANNVTYSGGYGTTNGGFFTVRAYSGVPGGTLTPVPTGPSDLACDNQGTGIWWSSVTGRTAFRYEIRAAGGLGSFVLTDFSMGELGTPNAYFSGVTVEGYVGSTLVCSTVPYNSNNGVSDSKFPISFAPFAGVRIDSFRINYVREDGTYASTFNLYSFTVGEASAATPEASDTRLQSAVIKGQAAASLGAAAATPGAATPGSVTLSRAQSVSANTTTFTPAYASVGIKAVKYASGASFANFSTDAAYAGQQVFDGDRFVVRATSQDLTIVRYYVINVTVTPEAVTSAVVSIPAPAAGGVPASAADIAGGTGFAVTGLSWNGALTPAGKFKAGTAYTATLTVTASPGYTFPAAFAGVTVSGASVGSYSVTGAGSGNSVACLAAFPSTAALKVTAIQVTGQPAKMSYKDGGALDLSGMVVTQTYNDSTQDTVTFTSGTAENYTSSPSHGSALSRGLHDGIPVTVTYTGVTPNLTAKTNNLAVAPLGAVATLLDATIKGQAVTSLGTPGASQEAVLPGSVTLTRAQGADTAGGDSYLTRFTPTDGFASVKAVKYASGASYANFASDPAYGGQAVSSGDRFLIRVTAEDGVTVNWYAVDATVLLEEITSVSLSIAAPSPGASPQTAADITGGTGFAVTGLSWNGALTPAGKFKAGTAYTATLTVTASPGYTFPAAFAGVTVSGASSVGSYSVTGTGSGNSVACTAAFPSTAALKVAAIEVVTQPELSYKDGNVLDLSGMAVTRTFNDGTDDIVTFTDGTAAGFAASPDHGASLSRSLHDGIPVTVTYTGVTPNLTAQTHTLSVTALSTSAALASAVIKGESATGFIMAASPEAAAETPVTLPYESAEDATGAAPYVTSFTAADGFASVKAVKYASGASYASFATDAAYAGQKVSDGDRFLVRVTAEDGVTKQFCIFTVTIQYSELDAVAVNIAAPAPGRTPQNAADTAGGVGFAVAGLVWSGEMTPAGKFKAGTAYTATLTLAADVGYTFPSGFAGVTVSGASSVGSYSVTGAGSGNGASCVVAFPATTALAAVSLSVVAQPSKLEYREGDALDLSGLFLLRTYNDGTEDTVAFADGTAAGFKADPANGAALARAAHDGQMVTVTETASSCFADTAALSVLPPLIPDSQIQESASGVTVTAEGSFSSDAQLVVTPIGEADTEYGEFSAYLDGRQPLSALEVLLMPEGFYEMPVTLSFTAGSAFEGYTLYIFHRLAGGGVELFTPTVRDGLAVITVTELSPFLLAADPVIEITAQPQDAIIFTGQTATFSVSAQGLEPLSRQWQHRADSSQSWQDIPSATGATHTTGSANLTHDGSQYRVLLTDGLGRSVFSDAATLTVRQSPPATGDDSRPVLYALLAPLLASCAALLMKKCRRA